jgi:arylsulfatase A-like enzyme
MIMKFPRHSGIESRAVDFPVQHADLYATLVDLLGLSARSVNTDGSSFAPWLLNGSRSNYPIVVQSTKRLQNALILDNYKYIQNSDGSQELYNLSRDPQERKNLVTVEIARTGYLRQRLKMSLDPSKKEVVKTETVELDEAAKENLKALGYLD